MRPNTDVAERQGDLGGQKIAMTFDQNSLAHLMSVMTDLYSDPELAVIREYSTNAWDSHKAVGNTRPIEVSIPNGLSPFFKVKDYGLGMDIDDIENIYSQYGASTKRDSNDQVGMLGLGCKSALSYTQQFTLIAVKNGMKYNVAISRTENGSGVMEIVFADKTDEPNGVEVVVPVKRGHSFQQKTMEFYRFWEPGSVLVDGEEPKPISGRVVKDGITMVPNLGQDFLVMGNVGYPIRPNSSIGERNYYSKYGVVARVDIGDINFTPSRESLHYTNKTIETIDRIRKEFRAGLVGVVQRDVNAAENKQQALEVYLEWYNLLGGGYQRQAFPKAQYDGKDVPFEIKHPHLMYKTELTRYAVEESGVIMLKNVRECAIIHGFAGQKITGHQRQKMREWKSMNKFTSSNIIVCDELPDELKEDWIPERNIYSWEDVRKAKVPGQRSPRPKVTYDVFFPAAVRIKPTPVDEFPDDKTIILMAPKEMSNVRQMNSLLERFPDHIIVRLQNYRWEKFMKSFPDAIQYESLLKKAYIEALDNLTDSDKREMSMDHRARNVLVNLDETKIFDPEIVNGIKVAKATVVSDTRKEYEKIYELVSRYHYARHNHGVYNPLEGYPLVSTGYYNVDVKHATIYINAVYLAETN